MADEETYSGGIMVTRSEDNFCAPNESTRDEKAYQKKGGKKSKEKQKKNYSKKDAVNIFTSALDNVFICPNFARPVPDFDDVSQQTFS
eukprot:13827978-Ditylum_brightwellii.AAC.1